MAPVANITMEQSRFPEQEYCEASILHRIPPEILMPCSASSITSNFLTDNSTEGHLQKTWLMNKKRIHDRRLERLIKFQRELSGTSNETDNNEDNQLDKKLGKDELLLDITLRTMLLMHHNRQLQQKLNALQDKTRKYIQTVKSQNAESSKST